MLPLRYDFLRFGGSWTQRQVFNVTMIQAAVKANKVSLALALVAELKVCLMNGSLTCKSPWGIGYYA